MNDTAQQNQNLQNTQITQNDQVDQKDQSGQNNQSVGSVHKEQGPVVTAPVSEFVKPSEVEPQLSKEVVDAGVQTVSQMPNIPADAKNAGLMPAKEAVPVTTEPSSNITFPITEERAMGIIKTQNNPSNSIAWLAQEVVKQVKIMHQKIINP